MTSRLGSYVAMVREGLGLSQKELAHKAGCSQTTVHRIETGLTVHPGIDVLVSLAKGLKVSPYSLVLAYLGKDPNFKDAVDGESLKKLLYKAIDQVVDEQLA